jgi:glutamate synthase (NADPH/NADH) small chain
MQGSDPRTYEINTLKFNGNDGKVTSADTVHIKWEFPKDGGRPVPVPIEGTEKTYHCDLVLLCMGFTGAEKYLMDDFDIMPSDNYETLAENIFTAGDFRRGQSLVIWGILEGRKSAERVDEYLRSL